MLSFSTHIKASECPWVTFIHGAGGSSTIWYKQLKAFSSNFNILLIDLRGHGRSRSPQFIIVLKIITFPLLEMKF